MLCLVWPVSEAQVPSSARSRDAVARQESRLKQAFENKGLAWGSPVYLRIIKETSKLEVWVRDGRQFTHFESYDVCYFSGTPGPKTRQGDGQSPEGFYFVKPAQLNPHSQFHLSFNIGYPNAYDRSKGYTGDYLMVHGSCVSIGCYAMTDPKIEEIWTLIDAAFRNGQPFFRIHIFPFEMTADRLEKEQQNPWYDFWQNLKAGYDWFEERRVPPNVEVAGGKYVFGEG